MTRQVSREVYLIADAWQFIFSRGQPCGVEVWGQLLTIDKILFVGFEGKRFHC